MRVLLIEDSVRLQQTVGTALRRSGYAVDVSGDGEDGLCIVTNLLDNAVEYSAPGSAVEIRGEAREGRFTLSVTNGVQHFSADDASHLFERFWRKDSARSGGNHAGLGLPLARAFATSLRCSLTATLNGDAHLTFTLSGPLEPRQPDPLATGTRDDFATRQNNPPFKT